MIVVSISIEIKMASNINNTHHDSPSLSSSQPAALSSSLPSSSSSSLLFGGQMPSQEQLMFYGQLELQFLQQQHQHHQQQHVPDPHNHQPSSSSYPLAPQDFNISSSSLPHDARVYPPQMPTPQGFVTLQYPPPSLSSQQVLFFPLSLRLPPFFSSSYVFF